MSHALPYETIITWLTSVTEMINCILNYWKMSICSVYKMLLVYKVYDLKWSQHLENGIELNSLLLVSLSLTRKQFCSCVRPVTLIYCVKMVTFFSFVCRRPKYRMLIYWLYNVNLVNFLFKCIIQALHFLLIQLSCTMLSK